MAIEKVPVQNTVFDLDSFSEVTLVKEFDFEPVDSIEAAIAKLGNDASKLLQVVNDGLKSELRRQATADPEGWHTYNDEGEMNGPFTGTLAEQKAVNALVLTLAKTVFSYNKDMTAEQKKAAKDQAMEMVKTTDAIKQGLRKSAAKKTAA